MSMLLFTHAERDLLSLSVDEYPSSADYNMEMRFPFYCHILTTKVLTQGMIS